MEGPGEPGLLRFLPHLLGPHAQSIVWIRLFRGGDNGHSQKQVIRTDSAPHACPYSQAIRWATRIHSNDFWQTPRAGDAPDTDILAHTENALENLNAILEAGGSSLENVLKVTVYLRNMGTRRCERGVPALLYRCPTCRSLDSVPATAHPLPSMPSLCSG